MTSEVNDTEQDQLLRLAYESSTTGLKREFLLYLPRGYGQKPDKKWPLMLFLHGNGERGNGLDDLDFVLQHGPLMEAWIQRRALPFIIISPQLPVLGELEAIKDRNYEQKPARLSHGVPPRNYGFPSALPIQRTNSADFPDGPHLNYNPYSDTAKLPAGWNMVEKDLIEIVDRVLSEYRTDPKRVYLTGLSLGGFGAFHLASRYPQRWAAMATVVGTGRLEDAEKLAQSGLPVWMFGGGKDTVVKPHWLYEMANALEQAGLPVLRFTMHEDMDHDAWKRVYEGDDLYSWLLRYSSDARPQPEKSSN